MESKIEVLSKEFVRPSFPTPNDKKEFKLSLLDQLVPFPFIPIFFFYQKQPFNDLKDGDTNFVDPPSKAILELKQSLSDCLTKFYPLAGKLSSDLGCVECDDSGALFVEAKVQCPLSQAVKNAPADESLVQFLPFEPYSTVDDKVRILGTYPRDEILLAVQISWFECGSICIGVCMSHKIADINSLTTFMNCWADLNRGDRGGGAASSGCAYKSLSPNFDLGSHLFPAGDFPIPTGSKVVIPVFNKGEKIVHKRFSFDREKLNTLKQQMVTKLIKEPTKVEVVTAFIWKQLIDVARVRNHHRPRRPDGDGVDTPPTTLLINKLWHAVNLRSKVSSLASALSEGEFPFGNLAFVATASFTCDDDHNNGEERDLVCLVRDAIKQVNEDYVFKCLVDACSENQSLDGHQQQQTTEWTFSSWCRSSTYQVDFGWGKPTLVAPAGKPNTSGAVVLTSRSSDEDEIDAWLTISEADLALLSDELLSLAPTHFFQSN